MTNAEKWEAVHLALVRSEEVEKAGQQAQAEQPAQGQPTPRPSHDGVWRPQTEQELALAFAMLKVKEAPKKKDS